MSESVSVAEELIEKGARALWEGAVRNEYDYAWDLNQDQFMEQAAGFLAAMFGPGWREGISREWTAGFMSSRLVVRGEWQRVEGEQ